MHAEMLDEPIHQVGELPLPVRLPPSIEQLYIHDSYLARR